MGNESAVVVGVDGSDNARVALAAAIEEATTRKAPLHLVAAYHAPAVRRHSVAVEYEKVVRDEAAAILAEAAEQARGAGAEVTTSVHAGDASGVLLEQSRSAALVVVGARGRGGFMGRLLGSVAAALPAHAACPVLVVPRPADGSAHTEQDYSGRVVVGVDASGTANPALAAAADEAQRRAMPLVIVAVAGPDFDADARAAGDADAVRGVLGQCLESVRAAHPRVQAATELLEGSAAEVLAGITATAELVVVGARGSGGFKAMRLGSTAHALLGHALGPVLVVR
ncbi:universal stress protein [Tomitella fengzijianii]|uniref:Universal stress protein n=1 Tax=Tomitella fengzijianii TaxID=2597660 RepID=A0A516X008_9ACTN|nr:universal stress protein [Tomitella fengzijianii]QDQ96360.1 universal stress protein [Tomitella fengzijianii]